MLQPQSSVSQVFALAEAGRNAEALLLLRQLAGRGDAEALFTLGDCHWRGMLVPQDSARGRELFRQASDAGSAIALRAYTNLLASGIGGARDWPGALARLAAEARTDTRRAQMLDLIRRMDLTPQGDPKTLPAPEPLSESPHVVRYPGLFTPAECDFLIAVAEPTYERSLVGGQDGGDVEHAIRTSDGAPMHWLIEDPAIHALNRRLAAASGTGHDQGEPLLILRYRPGQEYRRHFDALPGVDNQRIKTALVYLNQGYQGGETVFPKAGVTVRGRRGDGIVFRNTIDGGRTDPMSEHAGMPVTQGVKYLASRWIRARRHIA